MARTYTIETSASAPEIAFEEVLNEEQMRAVTAAPGPSLVIAGAGSGKTRTLIYRVAWLLQQGVPPHGILLLTFTNKAAREMLDRVAALLPSGIDGLWGGTFHSIGNRILRRHAARIGFRQGFSIMDREDQEDLIEAVVAREGFRTPDRRFPKGSVLAEIFSLSINTGRPVRSILGERYQYFIPLEDQIERVWIAYELRKKEANAMDFDDLLSKTHELFKTCDDVAEIYQQKFRHVLVDEYQDTNRIQSELVEIISAMHGSIMVVGDDAQSIYSWRGANVENILQFPKRHPDAQVFRIETNYRSVPEVLDVANAAILPNERQFRKNLRAIRPPASIKPALVPLATSNQQAAFVAQRILEVHEEGVELREIAVLYRAHFHSLEVQLELTRRGIPFAITSGLRFFEQAHVKDVAAFMKFSVNRQDEVAFKRAVKLLPGIGAKSAESLWSQTKRALQGEAAFARLHKDIKVPSKSEKAWAQLVHTLDDLAPGGSPIPPAAMIECILFAIYSDYMKAKFPNYDARRDDLETLANYAKGFESAEEFLSQLALLGALESADHLSKSRDDERVTLSTVHQAKGLEWKVVFIIWLTEGMFPNERSMQTPEDIEEERRLFHVGVTRSRDELYLAYPDLRLGAGYKDALQRPSRFLMEVPQDLLETWEVQSGSHRGEEAPF